MGASRKLQGEIDRVLKKVQEGVEVFDSIWNKVYDTDNANQKEKFEADLKKEIKKLQRYRDQIKTWIQSSEIKDKKVNASYEQALLDARKLIEREMERFKVCEKETKTKAFSKEGLVQQPKTDPKEKAKSETRDWLNNVVGELEQQVNYFEADIEGLSVKKGKTKPPRLAHLETSIARHKAHIMKLELILRLLDNDELSPEQVNDVRDFLEDYVERNQEDFDEFSDVDELYNTLPLEKVESLEDLVAISPGIAKAVGSVTVGITALGLKTSAPSGTLVHASLASSGQPTNGSQEQADETGSQDSSSDTAPRTPPSNKSGNTVASISASAPGSSITGATVATNGVSVLPRAIDSSSTSGILPAEGSIRNVLETSFSTAPPSPVSLCTTVKEDDVASLASSRSSPSLSEVGLGRVISRGAVAGITSAQALNTVPIASGNAIPVSGSLGAVLGVSDLTKRNLLVTDERIGGGVAPSLVSPLASQVLLPQISKSGEISASTELSNAENGAVGGRVFNPAAVTGVPWRPPSANSFQTQSETFRGRAEIAPDQREKFLLRLQQVQQGHNNLLGVSHLSGVNNMQFSTQQQNSLLQQLNAQSSALSSQPGLGLGLQGPGPSTGTSVPQQLQNSLQLASPSQHVLVSPAFKDIESASGKPEEIQQQKNPADNDSISDPSVNAVQTKNLTSEDDMKSPFSSEPPMSNSGPLSEVNQLQRDSDFSPGQPLPSPQSSVDLGVIGRRSASDLGAIGDNLGGSSANPGLDQMHNLQMLEYAYYKLPQPKDSERPKSYVPRRPAETPSSYPQVQAPIIDNPAFWERVAADSYGTDTLFFSFYFQPNTYQQYLAARELKKQSWRYHKKYNTWFHRHEEPKVTTDDYEQGTYVYFDFHLSNDDYGNQQQQGWCQRIKTEFTFEYSYLEDELV